MLTIKILGPGCANCKRLEQIARQVVSELHLDASIEKVTEYPAIVAYGIMATPGLVINERVMASGRIPSAREMAAWLTAAPAAA